MRDTILPQAQNQLDEFANQMSQALSNQTTAGRAVTSGCADRATASTSDLVARQFGRSSLIPIRAMSSTPSRSCRSAPAARCRCRRSPPDPNNQIIGVNFSGGMGSVVSQLNAAFGTNLQFSNPSGTVLQVAQRQRHQQHRQCAVGDDDRHLADRRQRAAAAVYRRHEADHRRAHVGRLADHRACRAHRGQSGAGRLAGKPRRLCGRTPPPAIRRGRILSSIR